MKEYLCDVLVVGGGPAGAFAAVKAAEAGAKVVLADKSYMGKSGCGAFGAGSFKAYIKEEDDLDLWYSKAVEEGYYINDQAWLKKHFETIGDRVKDLERYGVVFEKHADGTYNRIEGQGSSDKRPIKTLMFQGPQFMEAMRKACQKAGVEIVDKVMVNALVKGKDQAVAGALGFHGVTGEAHLFKAKAVVLTTGAQSYKSHYADLHMVTGDAHVMGLEAGAALANYEFSSHQLTHAQFATHGMNISQGLGALFVNALGEDFTAKYDPEYASHGNLWRISASMALEVHFGRGPLYLDYSSYSQADWELFSRTLPLMYRSYEQAGYIKDKQVVKGKLEWVSALIGNVGFGGGLFIDAQGMTTVPGLFAAGDASYGPTSGVEGYCAYAMPAASSVGAEVGKNAAAFAKNCSPAEVDKAQVNAALARMNAPLTQGANGVDPVHVVLAVQEALFPYQVYILRSEAALLEALARIENLRDHQVPYLRATDSHGLRMALEAKNMVTCAEVFLRAALMRKESRGSHIRLDYPEIDHEHWLKWILVEADPEGRHMRTSLRDIPINTYQMQPQTKKELHPSIAWARKRGEDI